MILEAKERGERCGWEPSEKQINKLNAFLIHEKWYEDLGRSTRDKDFQKELMLE